jgi:hypothetical protein
MALNKARMKSTTILLISFLFFFACKKQTKNPVDAFFEQTFKIIEDNSVKKDSLKWDDLKKIVKDSIKRFNSNEDAYRAISYTIQLIDDGHSVFVGAQNPSQGAISNLLLIDTLSIPSITKRIIGGNIGYIKLTGFVANDSLTDLYALEIRKALINIDSTAKLSGWIIDLRNNSGGKLTSEPLGLSPLLSLPLIGIAWDNKNTLKDIRQENNYFYFGNYKIDSLNYNSTLINKNKKIAVLVSDKTVSAGEFLALAFKFQKDTKLFGSKTKGKTSHLRLFEFMSNAKLLLATDYYCDKDRNIVTGGLVPDVECKYDESLSKAIEWIK